MVTAADYSIAAQVWTQACRVADGGGRAWCRSSRSRLVDLMVGLRVSEEDEREGLDITSHGETAYSRWAPPAAVSGGAATAPFFL